MLCPSHFELFFNYQPNAEIHKNLWINKYANSLRHFNIINNSVTDSEAQSSTTLIITQTKYLSNQRFNYKT